MIDPLGLLEALRRMNAPQMREMGELLIALAERRENSPNFDANMLLAIERVKGELHEED